ncbi:MAG: hypothetical protein V1792_07315 [Pseudomonadota bacterium]
MLHFFMDHELELLWKGFDGYMYDPTWRPFVFAFRLMLCTGAGIRETTQIRVENCMPHHIHMRVQLVVNRDSGEKEERYPDIYPIFDPYYREYLDSLPDLQEWLFPAHRRRLRSNTSTLRGANLKTMHVSTLRKRWKHFSELFDLRYLPPDEAFQRSFLVWFHEELRRQRLREQMENEDYPTTDKICPGTTPGRAFRDFKPPIRWKELAKEMGAKNERRRHLKVVR